MVATLRLKMSYLDNFMVLRSATTANANRWAALAQHNQGVKMNDTEQAFSHYLICPRCEVSQSPRFSHCLRCGGEMEVPQQNMHLTGLESAEQERIENEMSEWGNPSRNTAPQVM